MVFQARVRGGLSKRVILQHWNELMPKPGAYLGTECSRQNRYASRHFKDVMKVSKIFKTKLILIYHNQK